MPLNKPIEKRYHSITEVAVDLGVNASQLRYWEKEFTLLKPRTNARGKRFYSNADIQLIKEIHWLVKEEGHTSGGCTEGLEKAKCCGRFHGVKTARRGDRREG